MFTTSSNDHFLSLPWLQRKKSQWSLRSFTKTRQGSISTTSVISANSCMAESIITIPEPPSYEDPSHPWVFVFPTSVANRTILPREEEGHEMLPGYSCDINKLNFIHIKCEFSQPGIRSRDRSWRDLYVQVYGTQLLAYHRHPLKKPNREPIWVYSMQGAEVTIPTDYNKYRYVARLRINHGPQFLFSTQTEQERNDWIRAIESSIHVSSDLDSRTMPQFVTLASRRRRRRPRTTEYQETLV